MAAKRRILPYESLDLSLKRHVDGILKARETREKFFSAAALGTGASLAYPPTPEGISAGVRGRLVVGTVGVAALALKKEMDVIHETQRLGDRLQDLLKYREEFFPKEVVERIRGGELTHAHVTGKGNLVLTKERKYAGREIIPHPLKLRWRMKVPLRHNP